LLRSLAGHAVFAARRLRFLAETGWREEAAAAIAALPLIRDMPEAVRRELVERVELRRYTRAQAVFRQGDSANAFYVVRKGRLEIVDEAANQAPLGLVNAGESFGELGLLEGRPRAATVRALESCELFQLDKGTFDRLLAGRLQAPTLHVSISALQELGSLTPFRHLQTPVVTELYHQGTWERLGPGKTVVTEGEPGDSFYVVSSGQLAATKEGALIAMLRAGDYFGELSLLLNVPRQATVRTQTPVRLFRLERAAFDELVATAFKRGSVRASWSRQFLVKR
jgi:CRP-like cAMP-binding protein